MTCIQTLETLPQADFVFNHAPATMWAWAAYLLLANGKKAPERIFQAKGTIQAYINHSRWVCDCPDPTCSGAMDVSRRDPYFFCVTCESKNTGWQNVAFPAEADEIERLLCLRPDYHNRNWRPGESVAKLEAENTLHGIGRIY